jgi:RNA polymerase sigma factor (sigma-70 family)
MSGAQTLLANYAGGSESAFRDLVTSYVDLVFSTAFRLVDGDRPLAEDVTQTVFLDLARAAKTLPRNSRLGGWLHRHTCFVAAKARRGERRRQERERQAVEINMLNSDSGSRLAELAAMLDEAINQLGAEDRAAIVLRFFERRDFRAVGRAVGTSEDGARMRVNRALAKLHESLTQKGASLTAAALGAGLATQAVRAAPAGLGASVAAASLAGAPATAWPAGALGRCAALLGGYKLASVVLVAVAAALIGGYLALRPPGGGGNRTGPSASPPPSRESPPGFVAAPANLRRPAPSSPGPSALDLKDAKRGLRALLERPEQRVNYPPQELLRALRRFGNQTIEAVPILLERLEVADFETQKWALHGLKQLLGSTAGEPRVPADSRAQALAIARPRLSALFRSETQPIDLRRLALETLVLPANAGDPDLAQKAMMDKIIAAHLATNKDSEESSFEIPQFSFEIPERHDPGEPLQPETLADIVAVLLSTNRDSERFRFEVLEGHVFQHVRAFPDDGQLIHDALASLVEEGDEHQQLLAAFALAGIPGDRPPQVVGILVRALEPREENGVIDEGYCYRAADALGMLGPLARDAVPALLRFADEVESRENSSPSAMRRAERMRQRYGAGPNAGILKAACRIQPELRAHYPDIDRQLKGEEAPHVVRGSVRARVVRDLGATLADAHVGSDFLNALVRSVKDDPDPKQKRSELLTQLLTLWGSAPPKQRDAIVKAMSAIQSVPDPVEETKEPKPPPVTLDGLVLEAIGVLAPNQTANRLRLYELFDQWQAYYASHPAESAVSGPRFRELSESIEQIDPDFHAKWLKEVLRVNPNLDRVVKGKDGSPADPVR